MVILFMLLICRSNIESPTHDYNAMSTVNTDVAPSIVCIHF